MLCGGKPNAFYELDPEEQVQIMAWFKLRNDPKRNHPWIGPVTALDVAKLLGGGSKKGGRRV